MPAYFITAPDDLLLREKASSLASGEQLETHYAAEIDLPAFASAALAADLFSARRAIWLKEVAAFARGKRTLSLLTDTCKRLPAETTLILSQNTYFEGDFRKASSFRSSALKKHLETLVAAAFHLELKGAALREWTRRRALEHHGLQLTPPQVARLIEAGSQMPSLIDSELLKLSLLKQPGVKVPVRQEVFDFVVSRAFGQGLREVVDAVLARESGAFRLAQELYQQQEAGPRPWSDLYHGLQRLLLIQTDPQYRSRPEFRGVHEFVLARLKAAAARWRPRALLQALALVTEAEFRQRTNRTAGHSPLEAERNLTFLLLKQLAAL